MFAETGLSKHPRLGVFENRLGVFFPNTQSKFTRVLRLGKLQGWSFAFSFGEQFAEKSGELQFGFGFAFGSRTT